MISQIMALTLVVNTSHGFVDRPAQPVTTYTNPLSSADVSISLNTGHNKNELHMDTNRSVTGTAL